MFIELFKYVIEFKIIYLKLTNIKFFIIYVHLIN